MINLGTALYAHKETIEVLGIKINMSGVAGLNTSEHRHGIGGSPKMSSAAKIFDLLFKYPGELAVYASSTDEAIYCEIKGHGARCDGRTIEWVENSLTSALNPVYRVLPHVIYELVYGTNTEFQGVFKKVRTFDTNNTYLFCDSYYYGCIKDNVSTLDEKIITESEMQASFRSGMWTEAGIFSDYSKQLGKSQYETGSKSKVKAKKSISLSKNFIDECKNGSYHIAYEWPSDMKKFIIDPKFLDTFESTPEFEEIVKKIKFHADRILERMDMGLTGAEAIGKDALNILLIGKPGTGKTTLAYGLSAATGMPVATTAWNKHSDEDEVEGKTKIVDGCPQFVETNALLFHENGGIDVNEEINLADPSVTMGSLGQKLEYPYIVKKNGYETVVRHPLNVVIATMNVGTNGSNPLNQALANRFKTPYILDDPTRDTFIKILMKASGKNKEICSWVYKAYESCISYLKSPDVNEEEICQNLSIRTCLGAIENMEEGQYPVRALINSIVGAVAVVDLEVARNMQREKIECLPNPVFDF